LQNRERKLIILTQRAELNDRKPCDRLRFRAVALFKGEPVMSKPRAQWTLKACEAPPLSFAVHAQGFGMTLPKTLSGA